MAPRKAGRSLRYSATTIGGSPHRSDPDSRTRVAGATGAGRAASAGAPSPVSGGAAYGRPVYGPSRRSGIRPGLQPRLCVETFPTEPRSTGLLAKSARAPEPFGRVVSSAAPRAQAGSVGSPVNGTARRVGAFRWPVLKDRPTTASRKRPASGPNRARAPSTSSEGSPGEETGGRNGNRSSLSPFRSPGTANRRFHSKLLDRLVNPIRTAVSYCRVRSSLSSFIRRRPQGRQAGACPTRLGYRMAVCSRGPKVRCSPREELHDNVYRPTSTSRLAQRSGLPA